MAEGMRQLGKYRIVGELGAGGFATVFKAVDTTLDREVALKILHPPLLTDRRFVHNFRQEAKTLAVLRHPHIITIYEIGEIDDRIFIAMDLARGVSLAKAIASRQRIAWNATLALLKPICDALDYAHEQSVVHRDLKPANILIDKQRGALLSDFGFAKLLAENSASMTMSGGIVGTPGYIAPEVWENNAANPPVDIYALGCIVYEMLTGDVLFKGQTPMQAMRAHDRGPQFPDTWPDDVPAKIGSTLAKALARDPAARYANAGAFWQALNERESQAQTAREAAQRAEAAKQAAARRAEEAKQEAEQRAALAAQWRAEAERALDENNVTAAKMALGRWRAVAPDDPAIRDAQERLERLTAPAQSKVASQPKPIAPATIASARPTLAKQPVSDSVSPAPVKQKAGCVLQLVMYSLLLVLIAIVVIGILTLLGGKVSRVFSSINSGLDAGLTSTPTTVITARAATSTSAIDTRVLNVSTAGELLQYAPTALSATAGEQVTVIFKNGSASQKHNLVLVKGGDDVAQKVDDEGATAGETAGYAPIDPNVISSVKLLNGNEMGTASFAAPPAGTYTFLCTFPGHYVAGMKGVLTVR
jgi:uncharacterized cupredoxin-like copper-binding protein